MRIRPGTAADVPRALAIWRAAVDATHQFLTPEDRAEIHVLVAGFLPAAPLILAEDEAGVHGFLVMDGKMIDALFVDPAVHGRGIGSLLLDHALSIAPHAIVDASEQASNALPFYLARGFEITGRSETDPDGRPYPLIHLVYRGTTRASKSSTK
ncbi:MAG: acetyltransferase [Sphingomonadales bacterium]|nr:MAG: acetyltransferase [Sphingomonadales bacterium]